MKQSKVSQKQKPAADVVPQKKKPTKPGPVELSAEDLKQVSGGLPRGGGGWNVK